MKLLLLALVLTQTAWASFLDKIDTLKWGELEVIWVEDDRFPTYDVQVYFADGALADKAPYYGQTSMMFAGLTFGTNRYNQKEINDALEFYGANIGSSVYHEYSTFSFGGLTKDIIPTSKMVCHLFNNSIYPKKELKTFKKRAKSTLTNLVASHSGLASRVFREVSLGDTPYRYPTEGKISHIKKMNSKILAAQKDYFQSKVKKRIYITGPKDIKKLKSVFLKDCGWGKEEQSYVRKGPDFKMKKKKAMNIYLVPVPQANQAQIRVGRYLSEEKITDPNILKYISAYLGGGFTSQLMQETRVKRGLTYSIGAVAAGQKYYGRALVMTSTRSDKVVETIEVIRDVLTRNAEGKIEPKEIKKTSAYLKGRFLFEIESNTALLDKLMVFDHKGRSYDEIYHFPMKLDKVTKDMVAESIKSTFSWDGMDVVVLGSKKLLKELQKLGNVKVLSYKKYL